MSPVSYQPKANGFSGPAQANGKTTLPADVLMSKKMQLLESESPQANGFNNNNNNATPESEVFHDTHTLSAHVGNKRSSQDDEPIVIFDTQSNTSIAQTAKDQFAAALLRLQSGLDVSTQRLEAIEAKVDNLTKQQRQQQSKVQQNNADKKAGSWATTLLGKGQFGTLLYLGWPVLVFVAMRALERRSMLKNAA